MNCSDFDRLWISEDAEERELAVQHARDCADCSTELRFTLRLEEAARSLRARAPEACLTEALRRYRSGQTEEPAPTTRIDGLRLVVGMAAAVLLLVGLRSLFTGPAAEPSALLLDDAKLSAAVHQEKQLHRERVVLETRLDQDVVLASFPDSPQLEQVRFLEEAIEECRRALEANERHGHLRQRLLELTTRHNELLRMLASESHG